MKNLRKSDYFYLVLILAFYIIWSTKIDSVHNLKSFLENSYPNIANTILQKPFWQLLLPQSELTGSYSTTGLLLFRYLERALGSTGIAYQITTCLMLAVFYFSVLKLFNSKDTAAFAAIALSLSTHNYHIFSISGSTVISLVSTYAILTIFFQVQYIKSGRLRDQFLFFAALVFFMLSYEGWLDYFSWLTIAIPFVLYTLYKSHYHTELRRALSLYAMQFILLLFYLFIKIKFGYGQQSGSESDIVFNYPSIIAMIEDLVSNIFKQNYLTIANYIPPMFISSNTLMFYDKSWLIEQQVSYHEKFNQLAYMNHLFLWRYYAGFAMAAVGFLVVKQLKALTKTFSFSHLVFLILLLAIPFGGATHTITKFRPFNSVPLLGYHVWFNILMITVLFAITTTTYLEKQARGKKKMIILLFAINLIVCALLKPTYLNNMSKQVELGLYPEPIKNILRLKETN